MIINKPNNILSYFIKDFKDPRKKADYKQINTPSYVIIFYKDMLLYQVTHSYIYKHLSNIRQLRNLDFISNYKIQHNKLINYKQLFYKKDNNSVSAIDNINYISYVYIKNKYLNKLDFYYCINDILLLSIIIEYSNKCKYIYKEYIYIKNNIGNSIILIRNKYELHYYCKFFNLYFDNNYLLIDIPNNI